MVGVFAKSPGARAITRRSKYFLEDRLGIKRISPAAALHNEAHFDSFEPAELLEEPVELDQTVDCPSPEPSIMEVDITVPGWHAVEGTVTWEPATQKRHSVCVKGAWRE